MYRKAMPWVLMSGFIFSNTAFSADQFDYPELLVTPRASERLEMSAKSEKDHRWTGHLAVQASALATLTAGILQNYYTGPEKNSAGNIINMGKDVNQRSPMAGIIVGGGWLVTTALLSAYYQPYSNGWSEVSSLPRRSQREILTRERLAEESLDSPARLAWRLSLLSVATNFGASLYMMTKVQSDTLGQVADGVAMAMAFAPLVFPYHWQRVSTEQNEYKKRIYAPIAQAGFIPEPTTGRAAPGLTLAFSW